MGCSLAELAMVARQMKKVSVLVAMKKDLPGTKKPPSGGIPTTIRWFLYTEPRICFCVRLDDIYIVLIS